MMQFKLFIASLAVNTDSILIGLYDGKGGESEENVVKMIET